jgi:hypothetical protein
LIALGKVLRPDVDAWAEGHGLVISMAVVAAVLGAFAIGMRAARPPRPEVTCRMR